MSDHWNSYFCRIDDALASIASIAVDLGLRSEAPQPQRSFLIWVRVPMRHPRPDGLSTSDEAETLWKIEDALSALLKRECDARLVGRLTTGGRRDFYFYAASEGRSDELVQEAMRAFPLYSFESGSKADPEWTQYLDTLYPSPRDMQRIQNRSVVEQLVKNGDKLEHPRDVQHWIYFRTPESRQMFIERTAPKGFQAKPATPRDHQEHPHGLSLIRQDRVDLNSINAVVLDLFELANELDADYDGWETAVVKPAPGSP